MLLLLCPSVNAAVITFDGSVTNQVIDGFGVNANHRSWHNNELKPVLDALIDQGGMTLFRLIYDNTDWEATNANVDPYTMNWAYYAPVYKSAEFTKLWNLTSYLNGRGITNGVFFNFQGPGPSWLGGNNLTAGLEPQWAQMIASLLVWARYTNGLQFQYVAPNNEPDQPIQGIDCSSATQYTTSLLALSQLLDANGMSDVQFIGPDLAYTDTTYMQNMMTDPVVMSKLKFFGVHTYAPNGGGSAGVDSFIQSSAYPDRRFWITEFNNLCTVCDFGQRGTYDWTYCKGTAQNLFAHLLNNASAGIVWEAYDSYYVIPNGSPTGNWSFWGLFSIDSTNAAVKTYTPRKNFYTVAQISKWVRPGAQRIDVSGSTGPFSPLLAFKHTGLSQITIVGINTSASSATLQGSLASLPAVSSLDLYYTSATANLAHAGSVAVNQGAFSAVIPGDCVFTLTGFTSALTDIVQNVTFQITAYQQGATNDLSTNITLIKTKTLKITTKDVIALIGQAIPATFSSKARLVYVSTFNAVTNSQAFQIRDGSNEVDVTRFFTGTGRSDSVQSTVVNNKAGIATGTSYGLFNLVVTNISPATLTIDGFAIASHTSLNQKGIILGVDALNTTVSGKGSDTNGVPFIGTGTVTVNGRTVEVK